MDRIYHVCFPKNVNGTNRIIAKDENCLIPTSECFWKDPLDIKNGVKTRSRTKNGTTINLKGFDQYHIQKQFISCWVLGKEQKNNWFFLCKLILSVDI